MNTINPVPTTPFIDDPSSADEFAMDDVFVDTGLEPMLATMPHIGLIDDGRE